MGLAKTLACKKTLSWLKHLGILRYDVCLKYTASHGGLCLQGAFSKKLYCYDVRF